MPSRTPAPLVTLSKRVSDALQDAARRALGTEIPDLNLQVPADPSHGDFATAACLPLARPLRKAPKEIAQAVVDAAGRIDGVRKLEVAGPGYVNVFLERRALLLDLVRWLEQAPPPPRDVHDASPDASMPKVVVEHTNINPNKAAHIGHLRNAVLGDCLVRLLQDDGTPVEVQNYIDDTGVQVADVVVAFTAMEGNLPEAACEHVQRLVTGGVRPFDHECWDLYAAVGRWYAGDAARLEHRRAALHAMESGEGPVARLGELIATAVVRRHVATMDRIGVRYHLLPWEGDVLAAKFWQVAFERLKESGAVTFVTEGRNRGCWVMPLTETDEFKNLEDPDKVIVRGDGTVTYVGKDIAFQMWKLGLLGRDFRYRLFDEYQRGKPLWTTDTEGGSERDHPAFGKAARVYNVIDVRQSYLQAIVRNALVLTGNAEAAERSVHYAYEMVALTPATAEALGFELTDEDRAATHVEMSGRRGLGVKADDLLDRLAADARKRVDEADQERKLGLSPAEISRTADQIAVGALRYYMAKVTRTRVIAFDIGEALQFQGETGPYLQYCAVRAANIFRRLAEEVHLSPQEILAESEAQGDDFDILRDDPTWSLVRDAARLPEIVERARGSLEIAHLAKHAFQLAQSFNTFYREHPILRAETPSLQRQRAIVARAFQLTHRRILGLLGVPEPERM
jgi:arginyl-tRNA synthetase